MTLCLSSRVHGLNPSPTLELVAQAKELINQGHKVISLSVGEPDWPTFSKAKEEGIKAIEEDFTRYTPAGGIEALRQQIASQAQKDFQLPYSKENVVVGNGAKSILFSLLQVLCDKGDEVLIPSPYWVSYPEMVKLTGAHAHFLYSGYAEEFKLQPKQLHQAITKKSKVLLLNSPNNPTGKVYSLEELKALANVLKEHPSLWIITDDIYHRLLLWEKWGDMAPHLLQVAPELKDRTVAVSGVSKSYAMTGWRIGWALGKTKVIKVLADYQSQVAGSCNAIAQKASLRALQEGENELKSRRKDLQKRSQFFLSLLQSISPLKVLPPDGAFYVWVDVSELWGRKHKGRKLISAIDMAQGLLQDYHLITVPGDYFGNRDFLRLSFVVEEEKLKVAAQRLKAFIQNLS